MLQTGDVGDRRCFGFFLAHRVREPDSFSQRGMRVLQLAHPRTRALSRATSATSATSATWAACSAATAFASALRLADGTAIPLRSRGISPRVEMTREYRVGLPPQGVL